MDPLRRLSGPSMPRCCIVTPWKATIIFQWRCENAELWSFSADYCVIIFLAAVGGVTVKSQALGDVTILLFIRQANCLVEIWGVVWLLLLLLMFGASQFSKLSNPLLPSQRQLHHKGDAPRSSWKTQQQREQNKNPQSAGRRGALQAEYFPSCRSLIIRATSDLRE